MLYTFTIYFSHPFRIRIRIRFRILAILMSIIYSLHVVYNFQYAAHISLRFRFRGAIKFLLRILLYNCVLFPNGQCISRGNFSIESIYIYRTIYIQGLLQQFMVCVSCHNRIALKNNVFPFRFLTRFAVVYYEFNIAKCRAVGKYLYLLKIVCLLPCQITQVMILFKQVSHLYSF